MRGRTAGQKVVVMNPETRSAHGRRTFPQKPVDDFSIALWAFAERALETNGMQLAEITYARGRPLTDGRGNQVVGVVSFFASDRRLALWEMARTNPSELLADLPLMVEGKALPLWERPLKSYSVLANGDLARLVNADTLYFINGPHHIDGNILTWKFLKEALAPPKAPRRRLARRALVEARQHLRRRAGT